MCSSDLKKGRADILKVHLRKVTLVAGLDVDAIAALTPGFTGADLAAQAMALTVFVIAFLVLGYFGVQPVTRAGTLISQLCTVLYFSFFVLMPWYSKMDKTKPVPDRVTG